MLTVYIYYSLFSSTLMFEIHQTFFRLDIKMLQRKKTETHVTEFKQTSSKLDYIFSVSFSM